MENPQDLFLKYKQNPQQDSLIVLLQSLQPIIYAVCFKVVKNEADCQDVTQDVLVKLIREIHQLKKVEIILGWVHQIAFYTALEFKRNQIKQRTLNKNKSDSSTNNNFDDSSLVLHEHISKLDKDSQQLILLKFFDNKTFEEIFIITGKAYSSAHRDIQKVLATLKNSLEKAGYLSIASGVEKSLETNLQIPVSSFLLNANMTKEIKLVLQKKEMSGFSISTILPIIAVVLIGISLIAINKFSSPTEKLNSQQPIAAIVKNEKPNNKAITLNDQPSEEQKVTKVPKSDEIKLAETSAPEIITPMEKVSQPFENKDIKNQQTKSSERLKEFYFLNEKGESLFGGKRLALQQGSFEFTKGVEIIFSKDEKRLCLVQVISQEYFLNNEKNNMIYEYHKSYVHFESLEDANPIILTACSIIKVKLQSIDGTDSFLDGTRCDIFGLKKSLKGSTFLLNSTSKVKDGVALFYTKFFGQISIDKIFVGSFWGKINQSIVLNYGEITEINAIIEPSKEQVFQVLDSNSKPLESYFVFFCEDVFFRKLNNIDIVEYKKIFTETSALPLGNTIAITDKNGLAKTIRFFDQKNEIFDCYVFGKAHGVQRFRVNAENSKEIIELKLKNISHLSLIVKLNNEIYPNEVRFEMNNLEKQTKIKGGRLELPDLLADKYKLKLAANDFQRDVFTIDLTDSGKLEYIINLRPAENYIHGYVRDSKGKPIEKISLNFWLNGSSYVIDTNAKGYYKFSGLELNTPCRISIHSDRPLFSVMPEKIYPSTEEFNIILEEEQNFSLKVVGLDGKFLDSFKYNLNIYSINGAGIQNGGGTARKGELKKKLPMFGHYHFTIEVPDAPIIKKVIPILKAEDNVPIVLQVLPGITVSGFVKNLEGQPMGEVSLTSEKDLIVRDDNITSKIFLTGKDGFFKIENCIVGDFFWLVKKGYAPVPFEVKEENKKGSISIFFQKTFQVKGKLLNSEGKPYSKVNIECKFKYGTNCSYTMFSQSLEDGSYLIEGLNAGDWVLYIDNGPLDSMEWKKVTIIDKDEEQNFIYDTPKK